MQTTLLDFASNDAEAGFRLQHLEIYNWGTFDQHVWKIYPTGHNALLTGDIGSGKSTIVDAITTLLVPHNRITYNKAAGAENKERTLYSYIRGEYKNEKDDLTQSAKAVSLRNDNSYTVLLAYFYNEGYSQGITLAQVFWLKDRQPNPERFFLVSALPLSIAEHFSNFGSDILQLKKRLRNHAHVELFDNFKEYSNKFRNEFGIINEQALELFYQTVSLKSVGNLTEFVRSHMLEKSDIQRRINELRVNFDNLNHAHEAILKARKKIEFLTPLIANGTLYQEYNAEIEQQRNCREALPAYFAVQKIELLTKNIQQLQKDIQRLDQRIEQINGEINNLRYQEAELKISVDDNGGRRLQTLAQEIERLTQERNRKQQFARQYQQLAEKLSLLPVDREEQFLKNQQRAQQQLTTIDQSLETMQLQQVDIRVEIKNAEKIQLKLQEELISLRKRKNNIPSVMLNLRQELAKTLATDENKLPFIGELLQVEASERAWEGAIERLLHNFGLSLLVPESLYAQVSRFVEQTHLKGRLVYYRVKNDTKTASTLSDEPKTLFKKLRIKPDSEFNIWLSYELQNRFNHICCENLDDFRRSPQAITVNGQIKTGGQRHEKDDRYDISDRSRYILGWDNHEKIETLTVNLQQVEQQGLQLVKQLSDLAQQQQQMIAQRDNCRDILKLSDYLEINWQPIAQHIQTLIDEKQQLEKSSDKLIALQAQLVNVQNMLLEHDKKKENWIREQSAFQQQHKDRDRELQEAALLTQQLNDAQRLQLFPHIDQLRLTLLQIKKLTLHNIEKSQSEIRVELTRTTEAIESRRTRLGEKIAQQIQHFKNNYPAETVEIDAKVAAVDDLAKMLTNLQKDDLPRHEKKFKELLNEGTINSIALLQNQLNKEKQQIEDKIQKINQSLHDIEYNPGTYITLLPDHTQDVEIRDFQQDLRRCLHDTLNDANLYDEDKFLQVKALIERFNGREGQIDLDRRWTSKVIDVRNWFNFSASERWQEDHSEKEFYSDSAGKSGGQKEKLAYTILASALAYQFGLEWGETKSPSFRFVVIDEAFGKGSDESSRYALKLFKKLNLQLLIVTPLQKIHVIEDFVSTVNYVSNQNGNHSVIRNITILEHRLEKQRRLELEQSITQ